MHVCILCNILCVNLGKFKVSGVKEREKETQLLYVVRSVFTLVQL